MVILAMATNPNHLKYTRFVGKSLEDPDAYVQQLGKVYALNVLGRVDEAIFNLV